jgi:hypothetical protein
VSPALTAPVALSGGTNNTGKLRSWASIAIDASAGTHVVGLMANFRYTLKGLTVFVSENSP